MVRLRVVGADAPGDPLLRSLRCLRVQGPVRVSPRHGIRAQIFTDRIRIARAHKSIFGGEAHRELLRNLPRREKLAVPPVKIPGKISAGWAAGPSGTTRIQLAAKVRDDLLEKHVSAAKAFVIAAPERDRWM